MKNTEVSDMRDRRDRTFLVYVLLTHLDDARTSSDACTHHSLEHKMRTNWKVVCYLLDKAAANGWVEYDTRTKVYRITEAGQSFRALLEKAISPIYQDYLERRS